MLFKLLCEEILENANSRELQWGNCLCPNGLKLLQTIRLMINLVKMECQTGESFFLALCKPSPPASFRTRKFKSTPRLGIQRRHLQRPLIYPALLLPSRIFFGRTDLFINKPGLESPVAIRKHLHINEKLWNFSPLALTFCFNVPLWKALLLSRNCITTAVT